MRQITKPTEAARKIIMKIARGNDNKNTVFVSIWNGEVVSMAYYRSDRGEELQGQPKDCYEFHFNKPNRFANYEEVDALIEDAYSDRLAGLEMEVAELKKIVGREQQIWENAREFRESQAAITDRLEEIGAA
jgi:hypothetical protein